MFLLRARCQGVVGSFSCTIATAASTASRHRAVAGAVPRSVAKAYSHFGACSLAAHPLHGHAASVRGSSKRAAIHFGSSIRFFSAGTAEIKTPDFGAESITEGTLQEWQKKLGDYVAKGEILAVIETDKVSVEVKAEESGVLEAIAANVDDTVTVGQKLGEMKLGVEPPPKAPAPAAATPQAAPVASEKVAMPTAKPAETAPKLAPATPKAETPVQAPSPPQSTGGVERGERRVKMNRMRQAISRRLKEAQNTAAMLTTFQEVDMGNLMEMRKEYKDLFEKTHGGVRLGFMSAFLKASAFALGQIPAVNALIDDKTQEIVYRDFVDISVAVASPKGLVVPVVRGVQGMSLFQIENSIAELAKKAKAESLTLEDSMGGTFTISNGGVFGSMMGTPIINPPQSAILGMHATKMRPVVTTSGEIKPRPIMFLALTYDHRLVDGREAVTFLCTVRDQIEDPRRLLLEL